MERYGKTGFWGCVATILIICVFGWPGVGIFILLVAMAGQAIANGDPLGLVVLIPIALAIGIIFKIVEKISTWEWFLRVIL